MSPHEGRAGRSGDAWVDAVDARLVQRLHGGFPLVDRPFAAVGAELGLGEDEVIERLGRLLSHGVLTRFGPLFQIERAGGSFVLAAMAVPDARFDEVAHTVNARPEVAHNYRRESTGRSWSAPHAADRAATAAPPQSTPLNMWFVVAAESAAQTEAAIAAIELATGLAVLRLPKEREFHVELKLPIAGA